MTVKHIIKIKESIRTLEKLKNNPKPQEIMDLDKQLTSFLGTQYSHIMLTATYSIITTGHAVVGTSLLNDIDCMISTLEGMLAKEPKYEEVSNILDLIEEGESIPNDYGSRQKFIAKVFYRFNDVIKFDKSISSIANDSISHKSTLDFDIYEENSIADEVIDGLIHRLKIYCDSILQVESKPKIASKSSPSVIIHNTNNQSQSQNQTIEITFSQVLNDVQGKGLSDVDFAKLTKLLMEFENERQSKKKTSLWDKAKDVLKYLCDKSVEIGIAVLHYIIGALK